MGDTPQKSTGGKGSASPPKQAKKRHKKLSGAEISAMLDKGAKCADLDHIRFEDLLWLIPRK